MSTGNILLRKYNESRIEGIILVLNEMFETNDGKIGNASYQISQWKQTER